MIDKFDKLKIITEPESQYVRNAVFALGRKKDAQLISAFTGAAKTGVNGGSSTTFPSGNNVGVNEGGTASKINVEKLLAARELLMAKTR